MEGVSPYLTSLASLSNSWGGLESWSVAQLPCYLSPREFGVLTLHPSSWLAPNFNLQNKKGYLLQLSIHQKPTLLKWGLHAVRLEVLDGDMGCWGWRCWAMLADCLIPQRSFQRLVLKGTDPLGFIMVDPWPCLFTPVLPLPLSIEVFLIIIGFPLVASHPALVLIYSLYCIIRVLLVGYIQSSLLWISIRNMVIHYCFVHACYCFAVISQAMFTCKESVYVLNMHLEARHLIIHLFFWDIMAVIKTQKLDIHFCYFTTVFAYDFLLS